MIARRAAPSRFPHPGQFAIPLLLLVLAPAGTPTEAAPSAHPVVLLEGHCGTAGTTTTRAELAPIAPAGMAAGSPAAIPVEMSAGRIEGSLQALFASDHALAVSASDDQLDHLLACGDIGGVVRDGQLVMGLGEENDSGISGVAILGPGAAGTAVTLYLMQPRPQPALAAQDAEAPRPAVTVDIKGFAYNPRTVEVPAGGSVTWTNQDNAPHTVTGLNGAIPQSGAMPFGATFTQVFTTSGAYDYLCAYHPNMKGTVVVK